MEGTSKGSILPAIFLVAGTCIGGGMLAFPVMTGISGFIPATVMMFLVWATMTASALLLLEVSLCMEEGAHIITMTSRLLGPGAKAISWVLYLFICYASIVSYAAGGGAQFSAAAQSFFDIELSKNVCVAILVFVFGGILCFGGYVVGRINTIFVFAMIAAYFALLWMGAHEVKPELLLHQEWLPSIAALPLLLTSFSFQTMVPSLTAYLKRNARKLRWATVGGTTLTFIVYIIWEAIILGIVPVEGPKGLRQALIMGEPPIPFLREHVNGEWVGVAAEYFGFFAIVSSFLGMGFGLFDFLADGLKIKKDYKGIILLGALIIIPSLIFATQLERIFIIAMELSGGIGDTILNGMIPVLLVWVARYRRGFASSLVVPGGKMILVFLFAFFLFAFIVEILSWAGVIIPFLPEAIRIPNIEQAES